MTIDYKSVISHFCNCKARRSDWLPYKNVEIYRLESALQSVTLRQSWFFERLKIWNDGVHKYP